MQSVYHARLYARAVRKTLQYTCQSNLATGKIQLFSSWGRKEGREGNIIMFDLPSGIACPRYGPPKKLPNEIFLSLCVCAACCYVQLFVTPWTIAHQAPLSMEFPRLKY